MNTKPMRLVRKAEEPSQQDIAMSRIHQSWREWSGPNGKPWKAYDGPTHEWSEGVSRALDKGRYIVIADAPIPIWRRILRRIFRIK